MAEDNLTNHLKNRALNEGLNFFGVADLAHHNFSQIKDNPLIEAYSLAVSMAVIFPPAVILELKTGPSHTYISLYRVVNELLDEVALKISNDLIVKGYNSYPIPASQRTGKGKLTGIFPHRLAALTAGLGYRGKNNLIITPEIGSCIRLVSVLTNAPLIADKPVTENRCGKCRLCIENCPAKAIFEDDNGEIQFDATECDQYQQWVRDRFGKRVCGKCIAFCKLTV